MSWLHRHTAGLLRKVRPEFVGSSLKKLLGFSRTEVATPDGIFYADIASYLGYELFFNGVYEPEMIQVLRTYLKQGNILVELGANEGYFTAIASQLVGSRGKVIAVEPQDRLQPIVRKNLSLNGCENVNVVQVAVSDKPGTITIFISADMNTGSTSAVKISRFSQPTQEIPALPLKDIFEQQGLTTGELLKVDIEGYEYEAIMGSPDLFQSHRVKAIALELHPQHLAKRGLSEKTIVDFLESCGYTRSPLCSNTVYVSPDCPVKVAA